MFMFFNKVILQIWVEQKLNFNVDLSIDFFIDIILYIF